MPEVIVIDLQETFRMVFAVAHPFFTFEHLDRGGHIVVTRLDRLSPITLPF